MTATFGPSAAPVTQDVTIPVQVAAPGVAAIDAASAAAQQLGNTGLAARLNDLGTALTNLVQDPTNPVYKGQADGRPRPASSARSPATRSCRRFTAGLTTAQAALAAAATAADVQAAITNLGTALERAGRRSSPTRPSTASRSSLATDRAIAQPGQAEVFNLLMTNNGSAATTYDLSVSGLPAGVTAAFSQTVGDAPAGQPRSRPRTTPSR